MCRSLVQRAGVCHRYIADDLDRRLLVDATLARLDRVYGVHDTTKKRRATIRQGAGVVVGRCLKRTRDIALRKDTRRLRAIRLFTTILFNKHYQLSSIRLFATLLHE